MSDAVDDLRQDFEKLIGRAHGLYRIALESESADMANELGFDLGRVVVNLQVVQLNADDLHSRLVQQKLALDYPGLDWP